MQKEKISINDLTDKVIKGDKEALDELCKHYKYMIDDFVKSYHGDEKNEALEFASDVLKQAIIDYCEWKKNYNYTNIKRNYWLFDYIWRRTRNLDSKFQNSRNLSVSELECLAYKNDYRARVELFKRKMNLIERKALKFYNEYVINELSDSDLTNNIITLEDIYQEYYMHAWQILNQYYDNKEIKVNFVTYLFNYLKRYDVVMKRNCKYHKEISELMIFPNVPIDTIKEHEDKKEFIRIIQDLNERDKFILSRCVQGSSYIQISRELGVTHQRVSQKVKQIGKNILKQIRDI